MLLSTGRTGTQALAHHINNNYDNILALHEPKPSRMLRVYSGMYCAGRLTEDKMESILRRSRRKLLEGNTPEIYIESNNFLYGFVPVLGKVFPNLRIVHIVRDPRTYVPSHLNHGGLSGLKGLVSNFTFWMIKPEHFESDPERQWSQMTNIERLAWRWSVVNKIIEKNGRAYGDSYRVFRFESLFDQSGEGLADLCNWLDISVANNLVNDTLKTRVNKSKKRICSPWGEWTKEQQDSLISYCGEAMSKYHYL